MDPVLDCTPGILCSLSFWFVPLGNPKAGLSWKVDLRTIWGELSNVLIWQMTTERMKDSRPTFTKLIPHLFLLSPKYIRTKKTEVSLFERHLSSSTCLCTPLFHIKNLVSVFDSYSMTMKKKKRKGKGAAFKQAARDNDFYLKSEILPWLDL